MLNLFEVQPDNREYVLCDEYPTPDKIGVEIELENFNTRPDRGFKYWNIVGDGSLRNNGAELVMLHPTCGTGIKGAFTELKKFLGDNPQFDANERTSVHCHVDVRDMDVHQVFKMMLAYLVFEGSLYHVAGPSRRESNFCPPIGICDQALQIIGQMDSHGERYERDRLEMHIGQFGKYCGVNFNSIPRFGSLEFRMHEGTVDVDRIERWCNTLLCLKQVGREEAFVPAQLPEIMSNEGPASLCEKIFGAYSGPLLEDPNFEDNCYEGIRNAEYCIHQQQMSNYTRDIHQGRKSGSKIKKPQTRNPMGGLAEGLAANPWAAAVDFAAVGDEGQVPPVPEDGIFNDVVGRQRHEAEMAEVMEGINERAAQRRAEDGRLARLEAGRAEAERVTAERREAARLRAEARRAPAPRANRRQRAPVPPVPPAPANPNRNRGRN